MNRNTVTLTTENNVIQGKPAKSAGIEPMSTREDDCLKNNAVFKWTKKVGKNKSNSEDDPKTEKDKSAPHKSDS